jgi:hypothetical protein
MPRCVSFSCAFDWRQVPSGPSAEPLLCAFARHAGDFSVSGFLHVRKGAAGVVPEPGGQGLDLAGGLVQLGDLVEQRGEGRVAALGEVAGDGGVAPKAIRSPT